MRRVLPAAFAILTSLSAAQARAASTGYYLVPVYENNGEISLDLRGWQSRPPGASPPSSLEYGVGWGVTRAWYSELYVSYLNLERSGSFIKDTSWQNDVLLTSGQLPFDLALHSTLVYYRERSRGSGLEFGPVLQTEFGRTHVNAGVFFERNYGSEQANSVQLKYQWAVRHSFQPLLQLGLMGFGELGDWNDWATRSLQSHRAGPALWGNWQITPGQALKYEAGYLIGNISGVHTNALTARIQLVF